MSLTLGVTVNGVFVPVIVNFTACFKCRKFITARLGRSYHFTWNSVCQKTRPGHEKPHIYCPHWVIKLSRSKMARVHFFALKSVFLNAEPCQGQCVCGGQAAKRRGRQNGPRPKRVSNVFRMTERNGKTDAPIIIVKRVISHVSSTYIISTITFLP